MATRFLVVADLHYPSRPRRVWGLLRLLEESASVDALVLAGDFLDVPISRYVEKLFGLLRRSYRGPVYVVWGNHEHYLTRNRLRGGWDSLEQLERLRMLLASYGVTVLDYEGPARVGDVSLAGAVGWYDYRYGPGGYTVEDYERCNPFGAPLTVIRGCEHGTVVSGCPPWWWNDCIYVRLPVGNEAYARLNAARVAEQVRRARDPVVVVLHHVPLRELLLYSGGLQDFVHAYSGSPLMGEVLGKLVQRDGRRILLVAYGHVHERSRSGLARVNGVWYLNAYPEHPLDPGYAVVTIDADGEWRVEVQRLRA